LRSIRLGRVVRSDLQRSGQGDLRARNDVLRRHVSVSDVAVYGQVRLYARFLDRHGRAGGHERGRCRWIRGRRLRCSRRLTELKTRRSGTRYAEACAGSCFSPRSSSGAADTRTRTLTGEPMRVFAPPRCQLRARSAWEPSRAVTQEPAGRFARSAWTVTGTRATVRALHHLHHLRSVPPHRQYRGSRAPHG